MAIGTKKYIVRFGVEGKKDMLVKFRDEETVKENLARVIPNAVRQGLLPETCSVDHVELDHKGRTLNLDLPMKEHNIREFEVLILRDLSCSLKITMRIKPDKGDPFVESVTVGPTDILKDALKELMTELSQKHKFHGRRFKKYNLLLDERKLDLDRSLRGQDVNRDINVVFKPRILFEWPPGLFWPPGPYTTYLMCAVVVVLVVTFVLIWSWARKDEFYVILKSPVDCKVFNSEQNIQDEVSVDSGRRAVRLSKRLPVGTHVFEIFPREYPMYEDTLRLKPGWSDSVSFEVDPTLEFKNAVEKWIRIRGQYSNQPGLSLPTGIDVLVNRYPHQTDAFGDVRFPLHLGRYEIEYDLNRGDCREISLSGRIIGARDFVLDLTDSAFVEHGWIQFKYFLED